MIDELKLILDQLKGVPNMTYWILGGFMFYKLVLSLSVSGSVVYVIKMCLNCITQLCEKTVKVKVGRIVIDDATQDEVEKVLRSFRKCSNSYVHLCDVKELQDVWEAHKASKAK